MITNGLINNYFSSRDHAHQPDLILEDQNLDKDAIVHFVDELKENLHRKNQTLTSTFTGINTELVKSLNIIALSVHFDHMSFVPMYDFRNRSGNMALDMLNVTKMENFLDNLIELNVLPSKMIIGIHFFGHSFTHKIDRIQYEDTWGSSHGCEMLKKLKVANLFIKKSPQQKTVTFYSLVSENVDSIRRKVDFIKSRNLGGVSAFPVNFDDFLEKCSEIAMNSAFADQQTTYPLLLAINKAISETFLLTNED